ncbi:multicopper oxidase domain-containing protein [Thermosulfurimonas dismutans]|uniref:multicopper oxidase domain-containing protein n=1 Tax=Thermosulfurimonas dismutans TaxID=999894 RepID=UPI000B24481C|nr:multicopper oxidase domain-containing protein [Thermosulfurimonas dismutans]
MIKRVSLSWIILLLLFTSASARVVEYTLVIEEKEIFIGDRTVRAMTINGRVPGPILYFREGDLAKIHVKNLITEETSIHWHGVLVPPGMDGVPYVSFPPIKPGETFTYEFPIRHSGTYWYHSHTDLQEQRGVFGAIVIEPKKPRVKADKDYVVVLSDWTYEDPKEVLRTLKAGREWYALAKGNAQSLVGAVKAGMFKDFVKRELLRMPPMDLSDIAYDYFLINGKPESSLKVKPGETIRLRIINAAAGTNFYVEYAGGPMTVISADGQDVVPVKLKRFLIVIAETYDVLIKVPEVGAFEFRATAQDNSGWASLWFGRGEKHFVPAMPSPNLYHTMGKVSLKSLLALKPQDVMGMSNEDVRAGKFDRPGMMGHAMKAPMGSPTRSSEEPMIQPADPKDRKGKRFAYDFRPLAPDISSAGELAVEGMDSRRPWPPYAKLRALKPYTPAPEKPVRVIRLTLDGDMERYVWFMGGKPLSESDVIRIRKGEIVRFVLINRTMMHHPMHLHGHFFRVINGQGPYAPWKHTVDVAPMSTTVIEFPASEVGDWFFHCHILYHLESGMAKVVHYESYTPPSEVQAVRPYLYKDHWYAWAEALWATNLTEGYLKLANTRYDLVANWEVGWEGVPETDWEWLFFVKRYFNRFFKAFVGADYLKTDRRELRGLVGAEYLLPVSIRAFFWMDTDGGHRWGMEKRLPLLPRLEFEARAEYDSRDFWEGELSLNYVLTKRLNFRLLWHSGYFWGLGLNFWF